MRGNGRRCAADDPRPCARRLSVEAAVGKNAERVDVGRHSRLAALHLLGRAVAGRANAADCHTGSRMSDVRSLDLLCKAKVGENGDCVSPQNVAGLDVAVDVAKGMKFGDGIAY